MIEKKITLHEMESAIREALRMSVDKIERYSNQDGHPMFYNKYSDDQIVEQVLKKYN